MDDATFLKAPPKEKYIKKKKKKRKRKENKRTLKKIFFPVPVTVIYIDHEQYSGFNKLNSFMMK